MEGKQEAAGAGGHCGPDKGCRPALDGLEVRSPNITTNPAKIPSKLNKTCTKVKIVMPKIMSAPFQKKFRSADEGPLTYTRRTQRANRRAERVSWDRFALW